MLIISNKQLARLDELFNERYEALTVKHLSAKYVDWANKLGTENIRTFVADGVKRAERYDITVSSDVTAFLEYSILYGAGFEKQEDHEWAAGILNIRNISGAEKICQMQKLRPI